MLGIDISIPEREEMEPAYCFYLTMTLYYRFSGRRLPKISKLVDLMASLLDVVQTHLAVAVGLSGVGGLHGSIRAIHIRYIFPLVQMIRKQLSPFLSEWILDVVELVLFVISASIRLRRRCSHH